MKKDELSTVLLFIGFLLGGLAMFWFTRGQTAMQLAVGGILSIGYVIWGIAHHVHKGDFHIKVVIEYVLIGLIAFIILVTLTI